jgi:hypothetical protein
MRPAVRIGLTNISKRNEIKAEIKKIGNNSF